MCLNSRHMRHIVKINAQSEAQSEAQTRILGQNDQVWKLENWKLGRKGNMLPLLVTYDQTTRLPQILRPRILEHSLKIDHKD